MKEMLEPSAIIIFMILACFFRANCQDRYDDLRIDCGAIERTPVTRSNVTYWLPDKTFTQNGQNYNLLKYSQNFSTLNSLRFFPGEKNSCYNLPFYPSNSKFLFRAGFYYGNYDGLAKPPIFNLTIDGNFWTTVTASMSDDEPVYHEMIYRVNGDRSQVCLVRTSDGIPFISSLEATRLFLDEIDHIYRLMENKTALLLHSRINYGANSTIEKLVNDKDTDYECCNRIWESKEMSEYLNLVSDRIPYGYISSENEPPWPVLSTAIQAKRHTESIHLPLDFSRQISVIAYFVFYFRDPIIRRNPQNPIAKFQILLNNQKLGSVDGIRPWNNTSFVVSFYPVQVNASINNITISVDNGSELEPLLNAMEIFSVVSMPNGSNLPDKRVAIYLIIFHLLTIVVFCIGM